MSAITQKLFEMIENADPFYDEFWDEVLSENVNEFVANFSNQDWMDVVSILPAGKREKDYCLLETILDNCNDDRIVTSAIEKMVNLICQDEDMLWMIFMQGKILKLHLSKDVKTKLEKACSERINSLNKNIQWCESFKKQLEIFVEKEKTHYCPILDKQIDEPNCLEVRAIVGGEVIDAGGTGEGDYSKMYEVENYDDICQFDCQGLNLPLEKRRKCHFKNKEDYLKWKNSKEQK